MSPQLEPFEERRLYLRLVRPNTGRDQGRGYALWNDQGAVVLQARFADRPHGGLFHLPDRPEETLLRVRARRGFWWHGRFDVTDTRSGEWLGVLRRNGRIEDAASRQLGRIRPAEPARRKLLASLFVGVMDAATNNGGAATTLPRGGARIEVAGGVAGELRLVEWPFASPASTPAATPPKHSWLDRLGPSLAGQYASAWRLDFPVEGAQRLDARLRVAAAVLHVHLLNRWGN
jgi:hypothetical protein